MVVGTTGVGCEIPLEGESGTLEGGGSPEQQIGTQPSASLSALYRAVWGQAKL